jgi:hypothetical protein
MFCAHEDGHSTTNIRVSTTHSSCLVTLKIPPSCQCTLTVLHDIQKILFRVTAVRISTPTAYKFLHEEGGGSALYTTVCFSDLCFVQVAFVTHINAIVKEATLLHYKQMGFWSLAPNFLSTVNSHDKNFYGSIPPPFSNIYSKLKMC